MVSRHWSFLRQFWASCRRAFFRFKGYTSYDKEWFSFNKLFILSSVMFHLMNFIRRGNGHVVSTPDLRSVSRQFTPQCSSLPRFINGYRRTIIPSEGVSILLVASCYSAQGSWRLYQFVCLSIMNKKSFSIVKSWAISSPW